MPYKAIQGHTRPYKAIQGHNRTHKAMLNPMRLHIVMAVERNFKTIRGHIRPYKATYGNTRQTRQFNTTMCHKSIFFVPLHNFCSTPRRRLTTGTTTTKFLLGPLSVARGKKFGHLKKLHLEISQGGSRGARVNLFQKGF